MTIRLLRADDEAEWLRLRRALWPDHSTDVLSQEIADIRADFNQQPVFVAERPDGSDSLCGLVEVTIHTSAPGCKTDRIGYLEAWYVDPEWRGQGLGRRLVDAAEAWACSVGCREMASDTDPGYPLSPAAHTALGYNEIARHFREDLNERASSRS
jgi:aminoglycoside 6'-N-acetyltransferase I